MYHVPGQEFHRYSVIAGTSLNFNPICTLLNNIGCFSSDFAQIFTDAFTTSHILCAWFSKVFLNLQCIYGMNLTMDCTQSTSSTQSTSHNIRLAPRVIACPRAHSSRLSWEEKGTRPLLTEIEPPRVDGGKNAWLFLTASAVLEALVWGTIILEINSIML